MSVLITHLFWGAIVRSAVVILLFMTGLFAVAILEKRNDIADVGWGIGFITVALFNLITGTRTSASFVVTALVFVWGTRLALHIHKRNKHKQEDFRYKKWREEWGKFFFVRTYAQVFLLQGFLMLLISLPVIFVNTVYIPRWPACVAVGFFIWLFGFIFESIADRQLAVFLKNPANKGTILQTGLWRYTRHPNYFGEVVQWWGVFIIALSGHFGWITIIGPLTITVLILKVSGVPMLERAMENVPAYQEYKRKTSVFIPLPPRR